MFDRVYIDSSGREFFSSLCAIAQSSLRRGQIQREQGEINFLTGDFFQFFIAKLPFSQAIPRRMQLCILSAL